MQPRHRSMDSAPRSIGCSSRSRVAAIRTLLDDAPLRARLGAAGRERVMRRFTWEVTARGSAACYDAVLHGTALPESVDFT